MARWDRKAFRNRHYLGLSMFLYLFLFLPEAATGLQFYFFFDIPYSEGGTAHQYFTGSPRYKSYDCRVCHVDAPGLIKVHLWTEPEDIFQAGYTPNTKYTVHLALEKELRAPPKKIFSTNNFCLEVLDLLERNVGTFDLGFPWNRLTQLIDPIVLSPDETTVESGFFNFDLQFHWFWTAPEAGTGPVIFYCGFVDGNGDIKAFNDDVAVLKQMAIEVP